MGLFQFSELEILTFFAVLVRFSVMIAVLPFVGDRFVPTPAKVLFAVAISISLFPMLVSTGQVKPGEAAFWAATPGGIAVTIGLEVIFGLLLGYTARLLFDAINFGSNLAGNAMGFAMANVYDPHHETQTQVVGEFQMAIAMLVFLVLDGHHLMLRASLDSYSLVGLGKVGLTQALSQRLIDMTSQVIRFGLQIAAPVAISIFAVNICFGLVAKAMPQLNILILSFAVTALVGLFVLLIGLPEFQEILRSLFSRTGEWLRAVMVAAAT